MDDLTRLPLCRAGDHSGDGHLSQSEARVDAPPPAAATDTAAASHTAAAVTAVTAVAAVAARARLPALAIRSGSTVSDQ